MELREDLQIPIVKEKIQRISDSYETRTINHPYVLDNILYADSTWTENWKRKRIWWRKKKYKYVLVIVLIRWNYH